MRTPAMTVHRDTVRQAAEVGIRRTLSQTGSLGLSLFSLLFAAANSDHLSPSQSSRAVLWPEAWIHNREVGPSHCLITGVCRGEDSTKDTCLLGPTPCPEEFVPDYSSRHKDTTDVCMYQSKLNLELSGKVSRHLASERKKDCSHQINRNMRPSGFSCQQVFLSMSLNSGKLSCGSWCVNQGCTSGAKSE
mmetsp:Transcript_42430/g.66436  ORF Transcript_42430/g.66436 Transcript_42430/m.66436 type:complete len:190 (-) Transcript_42430:66-635(-)